MWQAYLIYFLSTIAQLFLVDKLQVWKHLKMFDVKKWTCGNKTEHLSIQSLDRIYKWHYVWEPIWTHPLTDWYTALLHYIYLVLQERGRLISQPINWWRCRTLVLNQNASLRLKHTVRPKTKASDFTVKWLHAHEALSCWVWIWFSARQEETAIYVLCRHCFASICEDSTYHVQCQLQSTYK